jgi:hypothetical protein
MILGLPGRAGAQETGPKQDQQTQQQTQQQTNASKPAKKPPPPLFHIHRRGMHKNESGLEVIDATPQSPPLEVDDPSVPGKGAYEINIATLGDFSAHQSTYDFLFVDANYGLLPRLFGHELPTQVKFEFPFAGSKQSGVPPVLGIGASQFGLKFNFYNDEHTGVSLAFYPQIEFAIPGTSAAAKHLANPGQTLILPLLMKKDFKYVTMTANFGVNQPIHDSARSTAGTFNFGLGRAVTRYTALMGEVRFDSSFDFRHDRLVVLNFGVMRRLRDNVILFTNAGPSIYSDDGIQHVYVGVGVKFLLEPKRRKSD